MSPIRSQVFAVFLLAGALASCSASKPPGDARSQLAFGIDMARRGLWNEALFRFEAASQQRPDDVRALNNLAVAREAVGRFDEALEAYRAALKLDPANRQAKQNYARFVEFYQSFRPPVAKPGAAAPPTPASTPTPAPAPTPAPLPTPTAPPAGS
jgi:tetratricopeptide (TPR) repeat protein